MQKQIKNIEEALDLILTKMESKGLLPAGCDKEELKEKILTHLEENDIKLDPHELNNEHTKKLLVGVVISQMLGLKDDNEFTKELKSENRTEPNDKLEKKLGSGLALVGLLLDLKTDKNGKDLVNDIVKPTLSNMKASPAPTPEMQKKHEKEIDALEKQLTESYRSLNGGDDPRITGEVTGPVLGQILGNLVGFTNQASADPKATSFMVESITYNAGKFDYTGTENSEKLTDLMTSMHASPTLSRE